MAQYLDLEGLAALVKNINNSITNAISGKQDSSALAQVATSGNYNDLTNTPLSLKNPNALNISNNNTTVISYDGSSTKSLDIVAGTNVAIIPDSTNGKITISSTESREQRK